MNTDQLATRATPEVTRALVQQINQATPFRAGQSRLGERRRIALPSRVELIGWGITYAAFGGYSLWQMLR